MHHVHCIWLLTLYHVWKSTTAIKIDFKKLLWNLPSTQLQKSRNFAITISCEVLLLLRIGENCGHLCIGTENLPYQYHWFYVSDPLSEKREKEWKIHVYLTHQIEAVSLNEDLNNSVFHVLWLAAKIGTVHEITSDNCSRIFVNICQKYITGDRCSKRVDSAIQQICINQINCVIL